LSIVIPCYNEEGRLPRTLQKTVEYFARRDRTVEIIVVNDGSNDNTLSAANRALEKLPPNITYSIVDYSPNVGKGLAVKQGMLGANGERVLFMDADYSVPMEDIEKADRLLDTGVDVAIGSRALDDTVLLERQSFLREKMAKVFGLVQRTWLGLKLMDTQCGFKLFTAEASRAIFSEVKLTSVIFDGEVLWLAQKLGYTVQEFPVQWTHDPDSRITYTPKKAIKVFLDMLRIPSLHVGVRRKGGVKIDSRTV
jgi:dolichyl-phosphate beta-glucosyltransferase